MKTGGLQDATWSAREGPTLVHRHAVHTAPSQGPYLNGHQVQAAPRAAGKWVSARKAEDHSSPKIKEKIKNLSSGLLSSHLSLPYHFYLVEAPAWTTEIGRNVQKQTWARKLSYCSSAQTCYFSIQQEFGVISIFLNYNI